MPVVRLLEYLDPQGRSPYARWFEGLNENAESDMALTRDFKETILARAQRDPRFRQALFTEAIDAYLAGDTATGKAMLRDLVNATVGFKVWAR